MMKILHILDHSLPLHSGYTFRSQNIIRCQQRIGLKVTVVTSPKHEESLGEDTEEKEELGGILYYRSGSVARKMPPFIKEYAIINRLRARIEDVMKDSKPDIIHAHSPVLNAMAAYKIGQKYGVPVIYEIRAFWEDAAVDHGTYSEWGMKYRMVRYLESHICKKVNQVITICDGLRKDLIARAIPASRIEVVPNAIDVENFIMVKRDETLAQELGLVGVKVLGFVGSFYHYEGLDLLLEAFSKVIINIPELRLLLVGGGEMEKELKERAKKLSIADKIIFTGRIPHEKIPAIYSLIDVSVLPRKSMRLTELVTPLKPLEAMAMKKLVLASNVGGHSELINDEETGYLFNSGSVGALVKSIEDIFSPHSKSKVCVEKAFDWVTTERTWQKNAEKYRTTYENNCC